MRYISLSDPTTVSQRLNIAIDGYSSCGKSTLAKTLAKELNYVYIDSGAMYRAMTLYALQTGLIKDGEIDAEGLVNSLDNIYITFKYNPESGISEAYLNTTNVEKEIRSIQVSSYVSQISDIKEVRSKLVKLQQRMAESHGVVMDGRDIGTVVLKDAALKLFLIADPKVRAQRRYDELMSKGVSITLEEVMQNVEMRDRIDTTRKNDPLRQAEDALVLDNTHLTVDEQFEFALGHANRLLHEKKTTDIIDVLEQ